MSIKHIRLILLTVFFLVSNPVFAEKPSDADALQGINEGKVVWDITVSSPKKLSFLLEVIDETYEDLVRQDVKPDMVFLFHGRVMKLITTEPPELDLDEEEAHEKAIQLIRKLNDKPGVRMESCSIAARTLGIDNKNIIPEIKPVGNTFVSQIGYQKKGYAMIPIH